MAITATSSTSARLDTGDEWMLGVLVTSDTTGYPVTSDVTVTVTDPDGGETTPEVTTSTRGFYVAQVEVEASGRWVAEVEADGHGVVPFSADVAGVVTEAGMPSLEDVENYLGTGAVSFDADQLEGALSAERAAQAAVCRIPANYPADLREALLRRVKRNLDLRNITYSSDQGDAGVTILPGRDPEIRRYEAPWRRLPAG